MALSKNIVNFLNLHNTNTTNINSLIVTNFLLFNRVENVKNELIKKLFISSKSKNKELLDEFITIGYIQSFEDLIEAFEFVISPSDKILNGAVYTPKFIREYIVSNCIEKSQKDIGELKIGDISCGCGGFLLTATELVKKVTSKSYYDIYVDNIYGIDIEKYSIERTEILLTLFAIFNGEDKEKFHFNLVENNSLTYNWRIENISIGISNGFDIIVGNPPYVCSRNMDSKTLEILKNIEVSNSGHPDLYIPFFQIGIENLNAEGVLGYITVNTFLKSINGRALRDYFSTNNINLTILNFGGEQLFKDRNTYTCLCFISLQNSKINYIRTTSDYLNNINLDQLISYDYEDLDNNDGWNLVNDINTAEFISKVERTGVPFGELYDTRNGIATLKNSVYKFRPTKEDANYYYFNYKKTEYIVEKSICRDIVNANKIKKKSDINRIKEKIIFPYDNDLKIISEDNFKENYPKTYDYLLSMKDLLATRDKGNREYEEWFAYGRRQSLDINSCKLFFPHICKKPNFVLCEDKDLLFYNGIAVISESVEDLSFVKIILESDIFYKYISQTTKDYASGYISLSKNYIKNFGIVVLDDEQKKFLRSIKSEMIESYLLDLYEVDNVLEEVKEK